jgi:hypothetical protein
MSLYRKFAAYAGRWALLLACVLGPAPACASFIRDVTDIELPWKVLVSSGDMRLVEFVIRPYFAVDSLYLAGGFNDWTFPGQGAGKIYAMEYDSKRDYWVCRVWLRIGAWEYIYLADGIIFFADDKNAMTRADGRKISRMVVR